jgi:hypothetical protein
MAHPERPGCGGVPMNSPAAKSITVALLAVALAFTWQALTVHYNYGGNWTGLFCTGDSQPRPGARLPENIYLLPASAGYDGQFYHYVAHDPLGQTGLAACTDAPGLRYSRILVPALAYLLAAGRQDFVDTAYFTVILAFVFLGAYWLARFAALHRLHPLCGLLFLALPATLISMDRMTVDVALAALWAGAVVCWTRGQERRLLVFLAVAPLVRETGLVLAASYCLWALLRREYRKTALAGAAAGIPVTAWWLYLRAVFPQSSPGWIASTPFRGLLDAAVHSFAHSSASPIQVAVAAANLLAVAASLLAVARAFRGWPSLSKDPLDAALIAAGAAGLVLGLFGSIDVWAHVYGHGRLLSPLLLLLGLRALERRAANGFTPWALELPAVGLQFSSAAWHVLRGLIMGAIR